MKQKIKILVISLLTAVCMASVGLPDAAAQCPMCKMSAESNLKSGGADGKGLNAGILFILSLPYLIVGSIGYAWWRNNRAIEMEDSLDN